MIEPGVAGILAILRVASSITGLCTEVLRAGGAHHPAGQEKCTGAILEEELGAFIGIVSALGKAQVLDRNRIARSATTIYDLAVTRLTT